MSKKFLDMVDTPDFEPVEMNEDDFDEDGNVLEKFWETLGVKDKHLSYDTESWCEGSAEVNNRDEDGNYYVCWMKNVYYGATFKVVDESELQSLNK